MNIGYARCSTLGQSYEGQLEILKAAGCETIFAEKESGAKTDRAELAAAMAALKPGDVLMVTRLDRLARSTLDLLTVLDRVAKIGAAFKSLGDAWCDTTTPHGKLMLTILGGLAEFERTLILARTGEGRRRAMAAGVKFGPKPRLTPEKAAHARDLIAKGESITRTARILGVSRQTIGRSI